MSERQIDRDDLIGAVCLRSQWRLFARFVQYWILDYGKNDPSIYTRGNLKFRHGLIRVDETNADEYLKVMEKYELSPDDIKMLLSQGREDGSPLSFVVNFDEKLFINGYYEQSLEHYPPEGWIGRWDEPLNYVPEAIQALWKD